MTLCFGLLFGSPDRDGERPAGTRNQLVRGRRMETQTQGGRALDRLLHPRTTNAVEIRVEHCRAAKALETIFFPKERNAHV
jgi:hypothetical protein